VRGVQRVQVESTPQVLVHKLGPDVEVREAVVDTQVLDPRREPLVQPEVSPPFLSNVSVLNKHFKYIIIFFLKIKTIMMQFEKY